MVTRVKPSSLCKSRYTFPMKSARQKLHFSYDFNPRKLHFFYKIQPRKLHFSYDGQENPGAGKHYKAAARASRGEKSGAVALPVRDNYYLCIR